MSEFKKWLCHLYLTAYHFGHHQTVEGGFRDSRVADAYDEHIEEVEEFIATEGELPLLAEIDRLKAEVESLRKVHEAAKEVKKWLALSALADDRLIEDDNADDTLQYEALPALVKAVEEMEKGND